MVLRLKNGRVSASGCYNAGSNYNNEQSVVWSGSYKETEIEWTERCGGIADVFNYNGFIENNKIWGTYKSTFNNCVGSFDFVLERLND
ncbi:unnamed protein product [Rotaria sp. Silwood2]|nr:unnamed protein product [Rotaria sp. Silwood2]CAF4262682.1 unnamed protein product [Rotaria sp. Silwood2]